MLRTLIDRRIFKVFRSYPVVQVSTELDAPARLVSVVALPILDGLIIPLPYGTQTDWLCNVWVAGQFTLEQKGVAYEVDELELIDKAAAEGVCPRWLRGLLHHTEHFLKVTVSPRPGWSKNRQRTQHRCNENSVTSAANCRAEIRGV